MPHLDDVELCVSTKHYLLSSCQSHSHALSVLCIGIVLTCHGNRRSVPSPHKCHKLPCKPVLPCCSCGRTTFWWCLRCKGCSLVCRIGPPLLGRSPPEAQISGHLPAPPPWLGPILHCWLTSSAIFLQILASRLPGDMGQNRGKSHIFNP